MCFTLGLRRGRTWVMTRTVSMPGSEGGGEYQSGNANDNELGLRELSETQSYVTEFHSRFTKTFHNPRL
jgi:hypothetical protein